MHTQGLARCVSGRAPARIKPAFLSIVQRDSELQVEWRVILDGGGESARHRGSIFGNDRLLPLRARHGRLISWVALQLRHPRRHQALIRPEVQVPRADPAGLDREAVELLALAKRPLALAQLRFYQLAIGDVAGDGRRLDHVVRSRLANPTRSRLEPDVGAIFASDAVTYRRGGGVSRYQRMRCSRPLQVVGMYELVGGVPYELFGLVA